MKHSIIIDGGVSSEIRAAVVRENDLIYYNTDSNYSKHAVHSMYIGHVANIEPTLQAVFINYGDNKNGLLPLSKIHWQYFTVDLAKHKDKIRYDKEGRVCIDGMKNQVYSIDKLIKIGMPIVVQIVREKRQNKGPLLTTYLNMGGRYINLCPNSSMIEKFSKKPAELIKLLKDNLDEKFHKYFSLHANVVLDANNQKFIIKEIKYLMRVWGQVRKRILAGQMFEQIYHENTMLKNIIFDYCNSKCKNIIIEGQYAYDQFIELISSMPRYNKILQKHESKQPVFDTYGIERLAKNIYSNKINLKSGGHLIISHTEALTTIDINSGSFFNKAGNKHNTSFRVNTEAAIAICNHILLRNIGGLIIIDFIDLEGKSKIQKIENIISQRMAQSSAVCIVSKMSTMGVMTIARQRIGRSLYEKIFKPCITCNGLGNTISEHVEACDAIRELRRSLYALDNETAISSKIVVNMTLEAYNYVLNECIDDIAKIKSHYNHSIAFQVVESNYVGEKVAIISD